MTRTPILVSTLLSFTTFFACGGGSKSAEEPAPAPTEEMPAEAEQPPAEEAPAEEAPAETPPAEPPAPEPKTLSEDLDGDGTPEEISLAGTELSIGEAKVSLSLPADKAAAVELKVIDLNKKDKSRELVLAASGAEGSGTWWVISYDGKAKTAGEPVELSFNAEPEVKGNGSITTTNMDCGQTITTPWKVKKGVLTKGKEKKKGKRDEAQCAGAAPAEGGSQG